MDELWKHYTKLKKPLKIAAYLHDSIYWNIQRRQFYKERLWNSGGQELEAGAGWGVTANRYRVSFFSDANILESVVNGAHFWEYSKTTALNTLNKNFLPAEFSLKDEFLGISYLLALSFLYITHHFEEPHSFPNLVFLQETAFPVWPKGPAVMTRRSWSRRHKWCLMAASGVFYLEEQFTKGLKGLTHLVNMLSNVLSALR